MKKPRYCLIDVCYLLCFVSIISKGVLTALFQNQSAATGPGSLCDVILSTAQAAVPARPSSTSPVPPGGAPLSARAGSVNGDGRSETSSVVHDDAFDIDDDDEVELVLGGQKGAW